MTAAAMKQDTYGLLQLSNPDLSNVLGVHLAVVTVLQAFLKHTVSNCWCSPDTTIRSM